jgi:fructose-1,6-bisphosphatase/inositol monophosphatase family enzyme
MDNNEKIKILRYSGAGNKSLYVALGRLNGYFLHYMNFWDLCGGDVLVKAQGGVCT